MQRVECHDREQHCEQGVLLHNGAVLQLAPEQGPSGCAWQWHRLSHHSGKRPSSCAPDQLSTHRYTGCWVSMLHSLVHVKQQVPACFSCSLTESASAMGLQHVSRGLLHSCTWPLPVQSGMHSSLQCSASCSTVWLPFVPS